MYGEARGEPKFTPERGAKGRFIPHTGTLKAAVHALAAAMIVPSPGFVGSHRFPRRPCRRRDF
jgi:hypothetical protein